MRARMEPTNERKNERANERAKELRARMISFPYCQHVYFPYELTKEIRCMRCFRSFEVVLFFFLFL